MNNLVPTTQDMRRPAVAFLTLIAAVLFGATQPAAMAAPSIPLVTGHLPGSLRNDLTALLGMKITVGSEDLTVTHLGRLYIPGNSAAHTLKIVRVSDKAELASASVQLPGAAAGQFEYAALPSPITLHAGQSYYIVSQETSGGDQFSQIDTLVTTRASAAIDSGVQHGNGYIWWTYGSPGYSFGLVDIKYLATPNTPLPGVRLSSITGNPYAAPSSLTLHADPDPSVMSVEFFDGDTKLGEDHSRPFSLTWNGAEAGSHTLRVRGTDRDGLVGESAPLSLTIGGGVPGGDVPLVSSFVPHTSRNDFSGLLGIEFVVGAEPLTVTALGRFHLNGNSRTHQVKLVHSSDFTDVPGAAATVSLNAPGQFQYAPLPTPVTLIPNGRYVLVSEETSGGDHFYNFDTTLNETAAAVVTGSAYTGSGFPWSVVKDDSRGYGPVNLKYVGDGSVSAPSVAITSPAANSVFTQPSSILLEGFASPGVTLVEFYNQGVKLGQDTSAPFQFQWANPPVGVHQLSAVATANGLTANSTPVAITVQGAAPASTPPTVSLVSPIHNATLSAPSQISLEAQTSTNTIQVQFLVDNVVIGTDTTRPFGMAWNNPPAGAHSIVAIASAQGGLGATSAPVHITVTIPLSNEYIQNTLPGSLRQDWTGFIGYRFTLGAQAIQVTALGRYVAPGNSGTHLVKLVRASDGQDLATASVAMAGASAGRYRYAQLSSPVTLNPTTSYFLVTEVVAGGDQWHDMNTGLTGQPLASLDGPIYFGEGWTFVDTPERGFGPLNFQYTTASTPPPQPPTVALTAPVQGSTHTNPPSLNLQASASASTIKVEFFNGTIKLGEDTSSPFSFTWNSPTLGGHTLYAIATADNSLSATSAPVQVNLVAAPAPPPVAENGSFIRQMTLGTPRNDFSGWVGYKFTIGASPVPVSHLGRFVLSGNSAAHTVRLVRASDELDLASVQLDVNGAAPNQFMYAKLASPVTLAPNTAYFLVSQESGDSWHDADTFLTPASVAALNGPVYIGGEFPWRAVDSPNHGFGPVDFLYGTNSVPPPPPPTVTLTAPTAGTSYTNPASVTLQANASASTTKVEFFNHGTKLGEDTSSPFLFTWTNPPLGTHSLSARATATNNLSATSAPVQITIQFSAPPSTGQETAFVVSKQLGTSRNNFSGFLGMVITVGPNPITITQLGRLRSEGDSQTHTVKLVRVNGSDVPGGSVQVPMAGGTVGAFVYAELAEPIILTANTTYFVVSEETAGGDRWHDVVQTYVTGTGVATVDSGIYGSGGSYTGGGLPGQSFVPVDFKYLGVATSSGPSITITSPADGTLLIEPPTVTIHTEVTFNVTKVEFLANGSKIGEKTSAPFTFDWNNGGEGTYSLTARATDAAGQTTTSSPVQLTISLAPAGTEKEFITGADPKDLRNNFDGFLGVEITVGPDPIIVTHLGRYVHPGNSRSHVLKIVDEKTGIDLPGAATSVSLAGGAPGQFVYGALPTPITLLSHELYFIVCEETVGGDQWSDVIGTVVSNTSAASVDGGVFGAPFRTGGLAHHSFGPVSFKYLGGASSIRPALSITSPTEGASHLTPVNLDIETEARGGITRVEFYQDSLLLGQDTTSPFSFSWTNPMPGNYNLTARGYTDAGQGATSGVVTVTITTNLQAHDRAFILGRTAGKLRHNFNGYVGMQFTVGDHPLIVTELGREFIEGNNATRLMKLIRAADNSEIGTLSLNMTGGSAGQYRYAPLDSPLTLEAHTTYYLVSQETVDGDLWQDFDTIVTATSAATVDGGVYSAAANSWKTAGLAGNIGGPVNFRYHLDNGAEPPTLSITSPADGASVIAPADVLISVMASAGVTNVAFYTNGTLLGQDQTSPFSYLWANPPLGGHVITARATDQNGLAVAAIIRISVTNVVTGTEYNFVQSVAPGLTRNDFSGFLGMTLTVGSTPLTVTQLGRFHVAGNTGTHLLKLVRTQDRQDVGSVTVSMAGGTPGQFRYGQLAAPVTLAANTIYHIVSQETSDGDLWHGVERTILTTTPVATVDSGVFGSNGSYTGGGLPNHSYVPLDFTYVFGTPPPPPTVHIIRPTHGSPLTQPGSVLIETETSTGIAKIEFFANNTKLGEDTSSPFNYTWAQPAVGVHQLKAIATSALGLTATSAIVQLTIQAATPTQPSQASKPFIIDGSLQQPRNNFSGFLGMEITVGPEPITVTHLGRLVLPGNSQTHLVKLVRWDNGQDVPGAVVSVDLASGTPNEFAYETLASPVTLEANTIYRLVSQETEGGDDWYNVERTTVTSTSVATVDAGTYGGPPWVAGGLPGHTYGPVNFKYLSERARPMLTPRMNNGVFYVHLVGELGKTVRLETSHDFINWTVLGTYTLAGEPVMVADPAAANFPCRFYRIISSL